MKKKSLEDAIKIWEKSVISLIDIRYRALSFEEHVKDYKMPANAFIFTGRGKAEVTFSGVSYNVERFGVFHGGKGTEFSIKSNCELLDYYMILYKVGEPAFYKRELIRMMEQVNPFKQIYGFSANNPIFFMEQLRKMYERWRKPTSIDMFYEKAAFYNLVYEIYKELNEDEVQVFQPDVVSIAKSYINENYRDAVSIQALADSLNISQSYLRSIFKKQVGKSPQEYLIYCRIEQAKEYLRETEYSIKDISMSLGFYDEYHFCNLFKKVTGKTPNEYKAIFRIKLSDSYIGNNSIFPYNKESLVRVGKLFEEGEYKMFKHLRNKTVIAAALSLTLLLSACSSAPINNGTDSKSKTEVSQSAEEGTRVIKTIKGDVEVPSNPKRIVVHYLMGDVFEFGVTPIGVSQVLEGAVFENNTKEATDLGSWDFEVEEVMSLEPDLIISVNEGQYEDLSKIAPTILVPYGDMTTEERVTFLGEVLNKQEEAKEIIADYKAKIEQGKEALKKAGIENVSVTILQTTDKINSVAGDKHALGILAYKELGLTPPDKVKNDIIDKNEYWAQPSLEVLSQYCGDYLIHLGPVLDSVNSSTVWSSIPAVKNKKIVIADTALTYYTDIQSSGALIDTLVDGLINISK
ncbi:AraC family transcriptional regulator [Clostridium intestinale]|uniref:AraC family transcriptional regulator n=1 Tax=Clostridium intestinale TaxID=36845 RepID=UPI002DD61FCD|nr:AraC family transcriptional regulator [Clostridium intestinale]WRY51364.1 AraC family transcriptional regulator [Clostridium intestinale]